MGSTLGSMLIALAMLCIVMVIAMVPFTMELLSPSIDMQAHCKRLAGLGPPGSLTTKFIPVRLRRFSPAKLWGAVYATSWIGIIWLFALLISKSEPRFHRHNVMVLAVIVGGWSAVHGSALLLGRALIRTNARPTRPEPAADDSTPAGEDESLTPQDDSAAAPDSATSRRSFAWLRLIAMIGLVIVWRLSADQLGWVRMIDSILARHRRSLLAITITGGVLGLMTFFVGIVRASLGRGTPMTHDEVEQMGAAGQYGAMGSSSERAGRFKVVGETFGSRFDDKFSLAAMKRAARSGAWRHARIWQDRFIVFIGVMMLVFGLFGALAVAGPAWATVLFAGALIYVYARTAWATWRA
jgi:hypothetical protein